MEAFGKGDVDGVMATYWNSPNTVSIGPDGMGTRGYDAIKAGFAGMFGAMPGAKLELTDARNEALGDVVLGFGHVEVDDSRQAEATGDGRAVLRRQSDARRPVGPGDGSRVGAAAAGAAPAGKK